MAFVFNGLVVAAAALIAYWWANQGFFSALLHFICVACAGAIAFALWEPITVNYLLTGGWFDEYAWGTSLLGVFIVSLFLLRLAFDKLVPDNVNVPTWANYTFGGLFGAGAGVLTVGICLIGVGFLQSSSDLMGFRGMARSSNEGGRVVQVNAMYPPLHTLTGQFYGALSDGAFAPTFSHASLRSDSPAVDEMAFSLVRDGFLGGEGKISLSPGAATVDDFIYSAEVDRNEKGAYGVTVIFQKDAFDRGEMLILSSSQIRLVGPDGSGEPVAVHPTRWTTLTDSGVGDFPFDDVTAYASSVPGASTATVFFKFPAKDFAGGAPEYLQVKGLRFKLPPLKKGSRAEYEIAKGAVGGSGTKIAFDPLAPFVEDDEIRANNGIQPLVLSTNQVSGFEIVDQYLASGRAEFPRSGDFNPGKALRIKGILEPPGIKIVKVDISRKQDKGIDFWGDRSDFRSKAGANATPLLVTADGRAFEASGYMWQRRDKVEIRLDPSKPIRGAGDLPQLSSAGTDSLFLIYPVSENARLIGFMLGQIQKDGSPKGVMLANCDLAVGGEAKRPSGVLGLP